MSTTATDIVTSNNTPHEITSSSVDDIIEKTKKDLTTYKEVFSISTSFDQEKGLIPFEIFDQKKLQAVAEKVKFADEKRHVFGRKNSQTTSTFMTMQMMNERNPFRLLRQILAQLEAKRPAVKEWYFKIMKYVNKIQFLNKKLAKLEAKMQPDDEIRVDGQEETNGLTDQQEFEYQKYKIQILEMMTEIQDGMIFTEGAIKEIAVFSNLYSQICRIHDIPEHWGEKDFEEHELQFHKRRSFVLAIRDLLVGGKANHGTCEYMENYGINTVQAYTDAKRYVEDCQKKQANGEEITEEHRDNFLDRMEEKYKDSHMYVLEKMGITQLIDEDIQFKSPLLGEEVKHDE